MMKNFATELQKSLSIFVLSDGHVWDKKNGIRLK